MSGPRTDPEPPPSRKSLTSRQSPQPRPSSAPSAPTTPIGDTASDVVRWAAFSCVLVPVVLLWYGTSLAGATGTALGLAAVTGVCRILLRQSERGAARLLEDHAPHRGRHHRTGSGAHRGGRHTGGGTPVA